MTADTAPRIFQGEILVAGHAGSGPALVLSAPISFWGGVDPKTGTIVDVRHPEHRRDGRPPRAVPTRHHRLVLGVGRSA